MNTLLLLGGSLVAVLLFVWARKLYERFPHRLSLDGEDYTRRSDAPSSMRWAPDRRSAADRTAGGGMAGRQPRL